MQSSIFIGYDARESEAFAVARLSLYRNLSRTIPIFGLLLSELQEQRLYRRPTSIRAINGREVFWDDISDAAMSTEHANARFLVPHVAPNGWAVFTDGDMLFRDDLNKMIDRLDPKYAVYCVKHDHRPAETTKMDGQVQAQYPRKNWSSFMVFNVGHPANDALTVDMVNTLPGRDLHRLCWLPDEFIGALDPRWNHLVGYNHHADPAVVHFTSGVPNMPGYENCDFADEWREERRRWIVSGRAL